MRPTSIIILAGLAAVAACSPDPGQDAAPDAPAGELVETATSEPEAANPGSCLEEIGAERAAALAEQCRMVSPATRPPCNPANSCGMIRDEIARGCAFGTPEDNPDFCDAVED